MLFWNNKIYKKYHRIIISDAKHCDWNGGELGSHHPGASMITCHKPRSCAEVENVGPGNYDIYPYAEMNFNGQTSNMESLTVYCDFEETAV